MRVALGAAIALLLGTVDGWKDLKRLVEATDKGTLLPLVVVDVNGDWQTRHVPGRADLRCLGRDL